MSIYVQNMDREDLSHFLAPAKPTQNTRVFYTCERDHAICRHVDFTHSGVFVPVYLDLSFQFIQFSDLFRKRFLWYEIYKHDVLFVADVLQVFVTQLMVHVCWLEGNPSLFVFII
jgi:hypothetical protein